MLGRARAKLAADRAWPAGELVEGEAEALPFADAEFDHLTFTYLLRYVDDPAATLRELARVVKPGGRVSSLEFCLPRRRSGSGPGASTPGSACRLLGRLVSRSWFEAGRFLGPSIEGFYRSTRCAGRSNSGRRRGSARSRCRRMSLGGGVVIWGTVGG